MFIPFFSEMRNYLFCMKEFYFQNQSVTKHAKLYYKVGTKTRPHEYQYFSVMIIWKNIGINDYIDKLTNKK